MKSDLSIAVSIKTTGIRPSLLISVASIFNALKKKTFKIYIYDDGPICKWKNELYRYLEDSGHCVFKSTQPTKSGVARNLITHNMSGEQLVLRMDDDFELGGDFNIDNLIAPIIKFPKLVWVSDLEVQVGTGKSVSTGAFRGPGGSLVCTKEMIQKRFHSQLRKYDDQKLRFRFADFTRNLMLIRSEVLHDIRWDEDIIFSGEHLDFQMSLCSGGRKGGYVCNSAHLHRDDLSIYRDPPIENELTLANKQRRSSVFLSKWGTDRVVKKYPLDFRVMEAVRKVYHKYWKKNN